MTEGHSEQSSRVPGGRTDERLDTLISDTEIEIGLEDGDCALSREDYFEGVLRSLRALAAAEREIESAHEQIEADAEYLRAEVTRGDRLQLALAAAERERDEAQDALVDTVKVANERIDSLEAENFRLRGVSGTDDPDEYSPELQEEYRRLWHEAAADRDRLREALGHVGDLIFGTHDERSPSPAERTRKAEQIAREALGWTDAQS